MPISRAQTATDKAPRTGRIAPSSDNSPIARCWSRRFTAPIAPKIPSATGRSNPAPSLRTLAGARLMVNCLLGYPKPELISALLMRSRLSRTAVSGMPTITESRALPDENRSTSTSIK